jgi:hypothetical protein
MRLPLYTKIHEYEHAQETNARAVPNVWVPTVKNVNASFLVLVNVIAFDRATPAAQHHNARALAMMQAITL